jgi:hypothetical protein
MYRLTRVYQAAIHSFKGVIFNIDNRTFNIVIAIMAPETTNFYAPGM